MTTGVAATPPVLQFLLNNGELAVNGSILTQVGSQLSKRMEFALRFKVDVVRFLGRGKSSQPESFSIESNARRPPLAVFPHSEQPRSIAFLRSSLILRIRKTIGSTKVDKPVVVPNPIDVIDLRRPLTGHIEPRESMRFATTNDFASQEYVALVPDKSGLLPHADSHGWRLQPSEDSCIGIVVEHFFELFLGKARIGHFYALIAVLFGLCDYRRIRVS